jgi:hypothetical protein
LIIKTIDVVLRYFNIGDLLFIILNLRVPFSILCKENMRISVKLLRSRRWHIHISETRTDGKRNNVSIQGL